MLQLNFNPFPGLATKRLLLRRITLEDAEEIFFLRSDEVVMRYIDKDREKTVEEAILHIKRINQNIDENEAILWGMELTNNPGKLIGSICLWKIQPEHFRAEIGYVLHPAHWGKGLMKEAIHAVTAYGFNKIGLHSIEAQINPANAASAGVLESTGFAREAYFRENFFYREKFLDTAVYSLLKPPADGVD